jgi:hypothetical protein
MTDAPAIELFRCDRHAATMSKVGCSRMWLKAQEERPRPWDSLSKCYTCDLGALHAGRPVASLGFSEAIEDLRTLCPRCTRRTDRMIRTRAPGNPVVCISCANRHYEAYRRREDGGIGKNGKGGRPLLCDVLHDVTLIVTDARGDRTVCMQQVTCVAEAIYAVARKAKGPSIFSRATRSVFEVAHYVPSPEAAPP